MIYHINRTFIDKAIISTADRGFRFGDGIFETIAVYSSVPYQLEWHLERLKAGLAAIKIANPNLKSADIVEMPESATLFFSTYLKPSLKSLPVNFKLAQGLNSTLARLEAQEKGCFEALQMSSDGSVCEASSANIFWVKGDAIFTPALSTGCLMGSARAALLRLAKIEEVTALVADIRTADEVFLTNANWQILPVIELKPMGWKWKIGKQTAQLHERLKADIANYVQQHK